MNNLNDKLLETMFDYNKRSLLSLIQITLFASILNAFIQFYNNNYLASIMVISYMYFNGIIERKVKGFMFEDREILKIYFLITFYGFMFLLPFYLLLHYYDGCELE